jgi:SAM-dependent methyltransferase
MVVAIRGNLKGRELVSFVGKYYDLFKFRAINTFRARDMAKGRDACLMSQEFSEMEKSWLRQVVLQVHPLDGMYTPGMSGHYLSVGVSALRCIDAAIRSSSQLRPIDKLLDFPSGYGRVLRFLRVRFPQASITGCELKKPASAFCRKWFSVNVLQSQINLNDLALPDRYDLIWCGSLFTHIDEQAAAQLLKFFFRHLEVGGICVFSAHGPYCVDRIRSREFNYHLSTDRQDQLCDGYDSHGYGYANYDGKEGYGISAVKCDHLKKLAADAGDWKLVMYKERAWDAHQDVYAFERMA